MLSSLILQFIKLGFNIYISNKVTPEALGVFGIIMTTYMFGITLASSGITITCMRLVSEELALENNKGVKDFSKKCIIVSLFLSLIASLLFFICSDVIVKYCFESKVNKSIVHLICMALPLISVSSAITGYFIAVRRVYKSEIGHFLEHIIKVISTIFLFNILGKDKSIHTICFILILGDVVSEIFSFIYLVIMYLADLKYHFDVNYIKNKINIHQQNTSNNMFFRIYRILFPISLTSCIKSGVSSLKQIIIPSSLQKNGKNSAESFSIYGILSGMAMPVVLFPSTFLVSVSSLLIPEFSRYYIKKEYHKIKIYTDKLLFSSFLFSVILTVILVTFGNKLGKLIYHRSDVGIYIKIFSLLIPFMYVDIVIDSILKGLDAQTSVMIINIIDLLVSTLFIFFFVPIFGIAGYIFSMFISEVLNLSLSLNKLLKLERSWYY